MKPNSFRLALIALFLCSNLSRSYAAPACCPDGDAFTPESQIRDLTTAVRVDPIIHHNLGIQTSSVTFGPLEPTFPALGTLETIPTREAFLSTRVPGNIIRILVEEGSLVKQGEPIMILETRQPGPRPPQIEITAPIEGRLTSLQVRQGQPVEPHEILGQVTDFSLLRVSASIPVSHLRHLYLQPNANLTLESLPQHTLTASFLRLADQADPQSHRQTAYFQLPNPEDRLRPGMRVRLQIPRQVPQEKSALLIPRQALLGEQGDFFVYQMNPAEPHVFYPVPVKILHRDEHLIAVEGALHDGQQVVTSGGQMLRFAGSVNRATLREAADHGHSHDHGHGHDHHHHEENENAEEGSSSNPSLALSSLSAQNSSPEQGKWTNYWLLTLASSTVLLLGVIGLQTAQRRKPRRDQDA